MSKHTELKAFVESIQDMDKRVTGAILEAIDTIFESTTEALRDQKKKFLLGELGQILEEDGSINYDKTDMDKSQIAKKIAEFKISNDEMKAARAAVLKKPEIVEKMISGETSAGETSARA